MFENKKVRQVYVVVLCLFVFTFFVQAKLSAYSSSLLPTTGAVHSVSQAQKLDLNKIGKLILPLLLVLLVLSRSKESDCHEVRHFPRLVRPLLSQSFDPDRFLRPPPSILGLA